MLVDTSCAHVPVKAALACRAWPSECTPCGPECAPTVVLRACRHVLRNCACQSCSGLQGLAQRVYTMRPPASLLQALCLKCRWHLDGLGPRMNQIQISTWDPHQPESDRCGSRLIFQIFVFRMVRPTTRAKTNSPSLIGPIRLSTHIDVKLPAWLRGPRCKGPGRKLNQKLNIYLSRY